MEYVWEGIKDLDAYIEAAKLDFINRRIDEEQLKQRLRDAGWEEKFLWLTVDLCRLKRNQKEPMPEKSMRELCEEIIAAARRPPDERTVEEQDEGTLESRGVPSDESYVGRILYCERVSPDEFPKPENL